MSEARLEADVAGLASLAEPTRRALYLYVRDQGAAVSRDEAAAGVGVPRHQAKFHLDKLVDDGLLEVEFARRTGRRGPVAGRPAKLSRAARSTGEPVAEALDRAARDRGGELAGLARREAGNHPSRVALLAAVRATLDEEGYQTRSDPAGLALANCPFHALAAEHTALICGMNLAIMEGLLDRAGGLGLAAVLDPADGRCCVRLTETSEGGGDG